VLECDLEDFNSESIHNKRDPMRDMCLVYSVLCVGAINIGLKVQLEAFVSLLGLLSGRQRCGGIILIE
jgi:hypothetical protein